MSDVINGWREVKGRAQIQRFAAVDLERLPLVSELLGGTANAAGTAWERPPLSLLLYLDGSQCKWCFSNRDFAVKLWGSVRSIRDVLLAIEAAIAQGDCEWKQNREVLNGFTHSRK